VSENHDEGGFAELPSLEIPPDSVDVFGSHDDSVTSGTKGSVTYESTDGFSFTVEWENPILGSPSCNAFISPGAFQAVHTCGVGEPAHMQFVVEPGFTPETILRKGTVEAGVVSEIAAIRSEATSLVTAVQTAAGTLKLIPWAVGSDGSISRLSEGAEAGKASGIDIARGRLFVTACRTDAGNLKLIGWEIAQNGTVQRRPDIEAEAGEVGVVKIVALSDSLFVTAVSTASGNLKLIAWELTGDNRIVRRGDSGDQASEVHEISLVRISPDVAGNHRVVTSVRAGNGDLLVITWRISTDGRTITRLSFNHGQAGEASFIRSVVSSSGHLVTSVKTGPPVDPQNPAVVAPGDLVLITWEVAADGNITRIADSHGQAGEIFDNALMSRPLGVLSAVSTRSGLKLIEWRIATTGSIKRIAGDSGEQCGAASLITLCQEPLFSDGPIITAVRTASHTLKLISWADHQ
jgi:hypothetical protein